jgi:nucleoside phosphorylase
MCPTFPLPIPLVVAPTASEFSIIQRVLKNRQMSLKLRMGMCGVGEQQAAQYCHAVDPSNVSHLILLGWAGALVPDLPVGAIVCANKAVRTAQPDLSVMPVTISGLQTGAILTSSHVLLSFAEKQAVKISGAIAVEMEAYPFAVWANAHDIPFTHGRVILDCMAESLPEMGQAVDNYGRLKLPHFLALLLKHPNHIPVIWHLSQRIRSLNPILGQLALDIAQVLVK